MCRNVSTRKQASPRRKERFPRTESVLAPCRRSQATVSSAPDTAALRFIIIILVGCEKENVGGIGMHEQ